MCWGVVQGGLGRSYRAQTLERIAVRGDGGGGRSRDQLLESEAWA